MNFLDRFGTEDRLGLYGQVEWKPSPIVQVIGGVRYDLDTFISPPRGSILLTLVPDHSFWVTIAVGYRPPAQLDV